MSVQLSDLMDRDLPDVETPGGPTSPTPAPAEAAPAEPAAEGTEVEQAPVDQQAAEAQPAAEQPAESAPTDEFPLEGIRMETTRSGAKQYVTSESAYNSLKSAYDTLQLGEQIMGAPLSREILQEARDARTDQHAFETALLTPTPESAWDVFRYLDDLSTSAREINEIQHDPLAVLAANMPNYLEQRARQNQSFNAAYQVAANTFLRKTLDNTYAMTRDGYQRAAAAINAKQQPSAADRDAMNRYNAARHLDQWVFGDFDGSATRPAARPVDPNALQLTQIRSERAALNRERQQQAQSAWTDALTSHNEEVESKIADVIMSTLKPIEPYYKGAKLEKALDGHQASMIQMLNNSIETDENFQRDRQNLLNRASRSNAATRKELLQQVLDLYTSKARILFNPYTNPEIRAILNQEARKAVAPAQAAMDRAKTAAAQRVPSGGGAPDRPAVPAPSKATAAQLVGTLQPDAVSKLIDSQW